MPQFVNEIFCTSTSTLPVAVRWSFFAFTRIFFRKSSGDGSSDLSLGSSWLGLYKCTCAVVCFLPKLAFYPPGSVHWRCVEQFSENSLEVLGHLVLLLLVAVVLDGEDQRVAGGGEGIGQNRIVENVLKSKTLFNFNK